MSEQNFPHCSGLYNIDGLSVELCQGKVFRTAMGSMTVMDFLQDRGVHNIDELSLEMCQDKDSRTAVGSITLMDFL